MAKGYIFVYTATLKRFEQPLILNYHFKLNELQYFYVYFDPYVIPGEYLIALHDEMVPGKLHLFDWTMK